MLAMRKSEVIDGLKVLESQLKVESQNGRIVAGTLSKWLEIQSLLCSIKASERLLAASQGDNFSKEAIIEAARGEFCNNMLKMLNPSVAGSGIPAAGLPRNNP